MVLALHPLQIGYTVLFGLTALTCFGAITRARRRLEDPDTRWGLISLLATCGFWAAFHVGRLVAPQTPLKLTFYILGLIAGLASVGAWLYFCSAYAGHSYHRQPIFRWTAAGIFLSVVTLKLTSPIHGLYFSTSTATTPFQHLVIDLGPLHWVVTGLAYALSAVGFYMLFDLFQESNYATRQLGILVGLAGLPVVFDLIGYISPGVIVKLNYEPVGVALFALGVLYVADGTFIAVRRFGREQLIDELPEAIILLDDDGIVRDVNAAAQSLFPALSDAIGRPLSTVSPAIADRLPVDETEVIEIDGTDPPTYHLLSAPPLTVGQTTIGRALVFIDVTELERKRREIERQQAQMDEFAAAITHELRNTVSIIEGHLQLASDHLDPDRDADTQERIGTALEAADRMTEIIADLATLARYGRRADDTEPVDLAASARAAWERFGTTGCRLEVNGIGTVRADPDRLQRLFEQLFQFAVENGATRVELAQSDGQLIMTDNGDPLTDVDIEAAFTYGEAVPDAESGMTLPVIRTLADAHGWEISIDQSYQEGVRLVIDTGADGNS